MTMTMAFAFRRDDELYLRTVLSRAAGAEPERVDHAVEQLRQAVQNARAWQGHDLAQPDDTALHTELAQLQDCAAQLLEALGTLSTRARTRANLASLTRAEAPAPAWFDRAMSAAGEVSAIAGAAADKIDVRSGRKKVEAVPVYLVDQVIVALRPLQVPITETDTGVFLQVLELCLERVALPPTQARFYFRRFKSLNPQWRN